MFQDFHKPMNRIYTLRRRDLVAVFYRSWLCFRDSVSFPTRGELCVHRPESDPKKDLLYVDDDGDHITYRLYTADGEDFR
jgi:hypothetical protein